ncbi:MAG: thiamine diphosphokinase [Bacteroidales bacterium]|nr:thiamine diphosphokinase [Bacteroidales bacterium]
MTTVILANGEFPSSERTAALLRQADRIICCDGAAERLLAAGIVPDLIVGDMDSLPLPLQERFAGIIRPDKDQETNDLTKAFKAAVDPLPEAIHILGATGKREDHTMANVSLLADYAAELAGSGCDIDMITESGVFRAFCAKDAVFSCPAGLEVSIFAFDNSLRISCEGLLYDTSKVAFDTLWKATLNKSLSESFSLHLNHPAKVIVFISNPD